MRGEEDGLAPIAGLDDAVAERLLHDGIEPPGRLVEDEQVGSDHQGGDQDALLAFLTRARRLHRLDEHIVHHLSVYMVRADCGGPGWPLPDGMGEVELEASLLPPLTGPGPGCSSTTRATKANQERCSPAARCAIDNSSLVTRSWVSSVTSHTPTRPLKLPPAPRHMSPSSTWTFWLSTSASKRR